MESPKDNILEHNKGEKDLKKIQERLEKLQKWIKEGKHHNDIEDLKQKVFVALGIPEEYRMSSGQQLNDVVDKLLKKLDNVQTSALPTGSISDEDLLKNASGGLALRGVYLTSNSEDMLTIREQLIEIPDKFSVKCPESSVTFEQREFSSRQSEQNFHKAMENFGSSFSFALDGGFQNLGYSFGSDKKHSEEREETILNANEQSYMANTKYHFIPMASAHFMKYNIRLSPDALRDLKDIETIISNSDDELQQTNRVKRFFEQFGSHVNKGPIHFGGIFWWRASISGFKGTEERKVKSLLSDSLDIVCGAGYGCWPPCASSKMLDYSSMVKGAIAGKYREALISQLHLSTSRTGGPVEIDDPHLWKFHLAASNKTWSVIDRGTDLIPVWEIMLASHRGDFKNFSELSLMLRKAYSKITRITVQKEWGENILSEVERANTLIQSIQGWSVSDCESHLIDLVNVKSRVIENTGSSQIWVKRYMSSKILQQYLVDIATEHSKSKNEALRGLMRSLFEFASSQELGNFPNRQTVLEWAHQKQHCPNEQFTTYSELSDIVNILQDVSTKLEGTIHNLIPAENEILAKKEATKTVTHALNSYCKILQDHDQRETELVVKSTITILGYSNELENFDHLIGLNEIKILLVELQRAFKTYNALQKQSGLHAQAFLVLNALTVTLNKEIPIPNKTKEKRLQLIKATLKDRLHKPIERAMEENKNDWCSLETVLESIQKGNKLHENIATDENVNPSIESILEKPLAPFAESTKASGEPPTVFDAAGAKFRCLIQRLGLEDFFPKKMTKAMVLTVDQLSINLAEPKIEQNLSSCFLYKLMMLNYRARCQSMTPKSTVDSVHDDPENTSWEEGQDDDDDDDFGFMNEPIVVKNKTQENIHPMDLQMAIFHCSNDFLRQYIFAKLSTCQLSLPFLVPNPCTKDIEFPLWALRHIKKSWCNKPKIATDTSMEYHNKLMFDASVPIVSFIRLGDSEFNSKSQILNSVICRQKNDVFFHRHCKGSTPDSLLMNGVVDIAWHCPGGREDELFDDCVAFLNLHGDAENHQKQLEFLQAVSTVFVILISEQPLRETAKQICYNLSRSPVQLICLFSGKSMVKQAKNFKKLAAKNRNQAELTDELILNIKRSICLNKKTTTLKSCCEEARKQQFIVDEDKESCQDGLRKARDLMSLLHGADVSSLKNTILPLQGDLWHKWCEKDRERYRLHIKDNESLEQKKSQIFVDMTNIRKEQCKVANLLNDFMGCLLKCFTTAVKSEDTLLYMLQWLGTFLENLGSDELTLLENKQHSTWREIKDISKDKEKIGHLHKKLDEINNQITNATVRLPHIMREVGQLYEAFKGGTHDKKNGSSLAKLPKIGASLLLSGYPLEILDGDASHVPITWIQGVLDELIHTVGDKKVFVLSILGLQSSGKSTLLNAMFGLQFSVSAGRCTRGAFMQLLEVDSSLQNKLGYEYVLIVDTEGIRSPELSTKISQTHDNELATFVIGIGDATVINIMGENPSEMQDILQICVQAFLRMRQVKITPSCVFVHQNVAESAAIAKNTEGRRRLLEKLDEMAVLAAREENIDNVTCFSDVIHFDIDAQVFYFKNLLEGDPPMAPPNPSYSQNVQELKMKLLGIKSWKEMCGFSTLSHFKYRLSDLWNALLQENFVFSFKNTVESLVYSSLEKKYGEWSWKLRKHQLKLLSAYENKIGSSITKEIDAVVLAKEFDEVYIPLKGEVDKYFEDDKNKEILIKWKANVENRFKSLKNELIDCTTKTCKELITAKEQRMDLDEKNVQYTNKLTEKSKTLASELQTKKLTDEQVLKEFDKLWIDWTTDVLNSQPKEDRKNVRPLVEGALQEHFTDHPGLQDKIIQFSKGKQFLFDPNNYIARKTLKKIKDLCKGKSYYHLVELFNSTVAETVDAYITAKENKTDFHVNFIHEILSKIEEQINTFNGKHEDLSFTNTFRVELSLHLCLTNVDRFQKMHEMFKMANCPLTYMKSQRHKYLDTFRNYCKGASSVKIFVDFLCQHITSEVLRVAKKDTSQQIADLIKTTDPAFNSSRSNLENHILKDLADNECFSMYETYIDHPKRYFEDFIQRKVEITFDEKKVGNFQENLIRLKNTILTTSMTITRHESEKSGNAKTWLDSFCKSIGSIISINRNELGDIEKENIASDKDKNWEFFKNIMTKTLEGMIKNKHMDLEASRKETTEILSQQMSGCWAQCPFCGAICTNTIPNHDGQHSLTFHRPEALTGLRYTNRDEFSLSFCSTLVGSKAMFRRKEKWFSYKTYWVAGDPCDKWKITADTTEQRYWKWFICHFQSEWENKYKLKFKGLGAIPENWKQIEKEDALEELK